MLRYFVAFAAAVAGLCIVLLDKDWDDAHQAPAQAVAADAGPRQGDAPRGPAANRNAPDKPKWTDPAVWHGLLGFYAAAYVTGRILYGLFGAKQEVDLLAEEFAGWLLIVFNLACGLILVVLDWKALLHALAPRPSFFVGVALHFVGLYDGWRQWWETEPETTFQYERKRRGAVKDPSET